MNMLFKTKDEGKIRICDRNIHKGMITTVDIHEKIKIHCYSSTKKCM